GQCVYAGGSDGFDEKTFVYHQSERMTEVNDALGNTWRYRWNESGQVTEVRSPLGATTLTAYDEHGRVQKVTDPGGSAHEFIYDDNGDLRMVVDPLQAVTRLEYNPEHRCTRIIDKGGSVWERDYDELGRLIAYRKPAGERWQFTYNSAGDVVEIRNPLGGIERVAYDEDGNLNEHIDALGHSYRYSYDEAGALVSLVDPLGNQRRNEYDALGRLIVIHWPDGTLTRNEYGVNGELLRTVDRAGRVTTYRSSLCASQWLEVVREDERWSYVWGKEPGQLLEILNASGENWTFEYDADGRLVSESDYSGRRKSYGYDAAGNLSEVTTGGGRTTKYKWDAAHNPIAVEYADGSRSEFEYDQAGRLISATDPAGSVAFKRDSEGRAVAEEFREFKLRREFDPLGFMVSRSSSLGHEAAYDYDLNGRLAGLTIDGAETRVRRDAVGREVARTLPGGAEMRFAYDSASRISELRVVVGSHDKIQRRYRYDQAGLLTGVHDGYWGSNAFRYDPGGRLVEAGISAAAHEQYAFDGRGSIVRRSRNGRLDGNEIAPGGRIERTATGRLEYDVEGRAVRLIETGDGPDRIWEYRWDARDRLIGMTRPDGVQWQYEYDVFDRRISKCSANVAFSFRWDGDAILHVSTENELVETWSWIYRRSVPFAKRSGGQTWYCALDHIGAARELVSGSGIVGWRGLLSPWGELLAEETPHTHCSIRLPGQWADAESQLSYNRFRYYAPSRMQYLSPDYIRFASGPGLYNYSTNPLWTVDPLGLLAHTFYNEPDELGRPGTATAVITPSDIGTGTEANSRIRPPGFQGGAHPHHHERGHLIGNQLGGDGNDPRNLVTMTGGTNHPHMEALESRVRAHVEQGNFVEVRVTPIYHGDNPVPTHINYHATDMATGQVIVNERVRNGQHKNYT
ncbi:MAG: DNA/RNA non-specific endonuclease, partial [Bryobacterales bacterium]|nr:DNA/RNA non-specific endonuclease [Bryobacterales bacterium]